MYFKMPFDPCDIISKDNFWIKIKWEVFQNCSDYQYKWIVGGKGPHVLNRKLHMKQSRLNLSVFRFSQFTGHINGLWNDWMVTWAKTDVRDNANCVTHIVGGDINPCSHGEQLGSTNLNSCVAALIPGPTFGFIFITHACLQQQHHHAYKVKVGFNSIT